MACFTVSLVGAIGVSVARHIVKHHEKKLVLEGKEKAPEKFGSDVKWSTKLAYLEGTLFAGSAMLAGEHIIHGEVVPFSPFLTAASSPEATSEMLHEIATIGVAMLGALVLAWAIGVFVVDYIKYKKRKNASVTAVKEVA